MNLSTCRTVVQLYAWACSWTYLYLEIVTEDEIHYAYGTGEISEYSSRKIVASFNVLGDDESNIYIYICKPLREDENLKATETDVVYSDKRMR